MIIPGCKNEKKKYIFMKRERERETKVEIEMYRIAAIPFPWVIEGQSGETPLLLPKIISKRDKLLSDSDQLY